MSRGQGAPIVVIANPKGNFKEGIISGTPSPGTIMEVKAGVALSGTEFTWQAFSGSTGDWALKAVLREDENSGTNSTTAYVSGTRGFLYFPLPGDDMNLLFEDASGSAPSSVGQKLQVQTVTGFVTPRTSTNIIVAQAMEIQIQGVGTASLTWCMVW